MRGTHRILIKIVNSLPDDMGISVLVQNSGIYATITKQHAIELSIRDGDAFISCDPGEGCEANDDLEKLQIADMIYFDSQACPHSR